MADWDDDSRGAGAKDNWEDDEGGAVKDAWDEEETEVKDSWDADEAPKPKPVAKPKPAAKAAPKKEFKDMTEEEKRAAQERNDFDNALNLFGVDKSLSELQLNGKDDIKEAVLVLYAQINRLNTKDNAFYVDFLEELFKALSGPLPSESVKKLWGALKVLGDQKFNEEKAAKPKDLKKAKVKMPKIKMEKDTVKGDFDVYMNRGGGGGEDEDEDDFM